MKPVVIDDSDIPQPVEEDITNWEPPRHVYFGPRDANGRMKPEPPYVYRPYPSTRYTMLENGTLRTKHVESKEDDDKLDPKEWRKSPADWGVITHPSKEDLRAEEKRRPRKEAA